MDLERGLEATRAVRDKISRAQGNEPHRLERPPQSRLHYATSRYLNLRKLRYDRSRLVLLV